MTAAPTETPEAVVFRRRFLNRMSLALGALAGAVVSVPILAYLLSPIINPAPNVWRDLGDLDDFTVGDTVEVAYDEPSPLPWAGQTARSAVWLRRTGASDFVAFALNCTHLGCPVNWRPQAELFLCPCHGGVYYANGEVAGGPPPRPLLRYPVRVVGTRVQLLTQALTFTQS
ncbi:MAG TPA: Rieske (2Fe-2S) protein [Chloroflexota bacterium]|jgi:menaquinol-cytochrome c reductase iron-sulfur subunit|nr:Rieske (2Fe-2S) protein [Chloroflexota bacterium]